jgi:hypothetical protein
MLKSKTLCFFETERSFHRMKNNIQNSIGLGAKSSGGTLNINLCIVEDNLLGGTARLSDCAGCLQIVDLKRVLLRLRKRIAITLPLTPRRDEADRLRRLDQEAQTQLNNHQHPIMVQAFSEA